MDKQELCQCGHDSEHHDKINGCIECKCLQFNVVSPPPAVGDLREVLAFQLCKHNGGDWSMSRVKEFYTKQADSILSLIEPYIEQRIKEQGYVKLAKLQIPNRFPADLVMADDIVLEAYSRGRKDLIAQGWRKVE